MNALMTIQVRVLSAGALAQLRALEAGQNRAAASTMRHGKAHQWALPYLSKWGNQVQWAGRQLMYNFTLPLAVAAAAGTKWALDNEKAMVRVTKVYGDGSKVFNRLSQTEIPALGRAFEALSNRFGVAQAEVINIAGDWAAAGASGVALAKSVKLTLETMVLGELDAAQATKQLIAIQAQYGFGIKDLTKTIDILNMVENQTGASMKDLMDGMSRAAGVARVAGVDVEHLSAMMAALVPATGSAATAGNALKTLISRLIAPTQDAVSLLKEVGLNVEGTGWQSMNAADRIELLAKRFKDLSGPAKSNLASVIGSRWQYNRLVVLLEDVNRQNGYYRKSLASTSDTQRVFNQRQKELLQVLQSNPQRVKQAWVMMQNAASSAMVPLLPAITYLIQQLAKLTQWFSELAIGTQKWVLVGLVVLALIGPLARYVGALANLFGLLLGFVKFLAGSFMFLGRALVLPFLLLGRMIALPFRGLATAFMLVGKGAIAMSAMMLRGVVTTVAIMFGSIWLTPMKTLLGFFKVWAIQATLFLTAPFRAGIMAAFLPFRAAFLAAWGVFNAGLTMIWLGFQYSIAAGWTAIRGTFMLSIAVLAQGMRGALAAITVMFFTSLSKIAWTLSRIPVLFALAVHSIPAIMARVAGALIAVNTAMWAGIARLAPLALRALTGPIGLAVMAALALAYAFRDRIVQAFHATVKALGNAAGWIGQTFAPVGDFFNSLAGVISDAFWALPESIRNAMMTVLNIIISAAQQIYEWMSYLNPFARHSPSLVDQVKKGNDVIGKSYANTAKSVQRHQATMRKSAIAKHEKSVESWKKKLDRANFALDVQQNKLSVLRTQLDILQTMYDRHKEKLDVFANAPLKGMGAMEDAIFKNEMAQKRLRLEMLRWEAVNGSFDGMKSRLEAIRGDIELLRGESAALRAGGAGSDILGPIEAQISAMEAQANALEKTAQSSPVGRLNAEMEELTRQGEILDLEKSLKFDPLTRQIDKLVNSQKEMDFETIVKGIRKEKGAMDRLQPGITRLTNAVNAQELAVKRQQLVRDRIQASMDRERAKLGALKGSYDDLGGAMDKAGAKAAKLKGLGAAAKKGAGAEGFAVKSFRAAQAGDFPKIGQDAKIGREGGMGDQSKLIDQFTKETLADMGGLMGDFDLMGPLKKKWNSAWGWVKENIGPIVRRIGGGIRDAWQAIPNPFENEALVSKATGVFVAVREKALWLWGWLKSIWRLFAPEFRRIWKAVKDAGMKIWKEIGPELVTFFKEIWELAKNLWPVIKVVAAVIGVVLLGAIKIVAAILSRVLWPILETIIDVFKGLIRIATGVIQVISGIIGVLTGGGWGEVGRILMGIWNIIRGFVGGIWAIFRGFGKTLWGIVRGIVWGVVRFFMWLYNKIVGHSIIPDLVKGIFKVVRNLIRLGIWIWKNVLKPTYDWFVKVKNKYIIPALRTWWRGFTTPLRALWALARWLWDHAIKPMYDRFVNVRNKYIVPALKTWWKGFTTPLRALWGLGKWIWDHAVKPIYDRFVSGFNKIKTFIKNFSLRDVIRSFVNGAIRGVNRLVSGLNAVSRALPGINFHINPIPELATGGPIPSQRVGAGFVANRARAIVGEGRTGYPEFVIPTDPRYRDNAKALLEAANQRVGLYQRDVVPTSMGKFQNGVPALQDGGIIGTIKSAVGSAANAIKGAAGWMKGNLRKLASTIFNKFRPWAAQRIKSIDWAPARGMGNAALNFVDRYIRGADAALYQKATEIRRLQARRRAAAAAAAGKYNGPPGGWTYPLTRRVGITQYPGSGHNPPNSVDLGAPSGTGVRAVTRGVVSSRRSVVGSYGNYLILSHAGGVQSLYAHLRGFNVRQGQAVKTGQLIGRSGSTGNSTGPHLHFEIRPSGNTVSAMRAHGVALRAGGIVRSRMGGAWANIGEGGRDEAVIPLPHDWRNSVRSGGTGGSGETHLHFHDAKLEFPNVKDGNDAKEFIKNLEILAKD